MKLYRHIITAVSILFFVSSGSSQSRPKAISTIWSLNGIGIGYEHVIDEKSFIQSDLRAEMTEVFINRKGKAGATASFTWNMVFSHFSSGNGNLINLYAGPGAITGIANDRGAGYGGVFGFKGRIGAECTFNRHITLSMCIAPTLGMHLCRRNGSINMRLYRNGLIYGILPELGIKYAF